MLNLDIIEIKFSYIRYQKSCLKQA